MHILLDSCLRFFLNKSWYFKRTKFNKERFSLGPNFSFLFLCCCHFWFYFYQISNTSAQGDFDGLSQNIIFQRNQGSGSCSFTVSNDDIPERNETFILELILLAGSGTVVSPSQALLTILENDDAFGIIGFNEVMYL